MTKVHYFGPNLKRLRIQSGLSQAELGERLDTKVNGQAISNWEREINHPTYENLIGIAKFFNVMPSESIFGTNERQDVGMKNLQLDGTKLRSFVKTQSIHSVLSVIEKY